MAKNDGEGDSSAPGSARPLSGAACDSAPAVATAAAGSAAATTSVLAPFVPSTSAVADGAKGKPSLRGRNFSLDTFDPAALAVAGVNANACVKVEVEARDTLFCAFVDYVAATAVEATTSLWLQPGLWRENEMADPGWDVVDPIDGKTPLEKGDELEFEPLYSAGPGVVRLPTPDGSAVWAAVGVNRYIHPGPPQRVLCLYSPISESASGTTVVGGAEAAEPTAADDEVGTSAAYKGESPAAVARARLSALITTVLKWRRDTEEAKAKVNTYRLYRFQLMDDLNGRWRSQGIHLTRRVETVILDVAIRDRLLNDARAFDTTAALRWYTRHGLPYRRCYLLYGPPGTGKSSFVRVLAGELKRSISFLQCSQNKMSDQVCLGGTCGVALAWGAHFDAPGAAWLPAECWFVGSWQGGASAARGTSGMTSVSGSLTLRTISDLGPTRMEP